MSQPNPEPTSNEPAVISPTPIAAALPLTVVATNLTKQYTEDFVAVQGLNLQIEQGAIFGFIGPNGAGKTTTMRMMATLLLPTTGDVSICGLSISNQRSGNLQNLRRLIGYMPDVIGSYERMTAREYLDFFAGAYHIEPKKRTNLINDLLELVDLTTKRDTYIEGLSRGMTQRLALARTLIHDPQLLILDEPASGLDPRARVEFRELVKELRSMGKTIIISSHILTELGELCTHVGIIERGKLLVSGTIGDIQRSIQTTNRAVELKLRPVADEYVAQVQAFLSGCPGVRMVQPMERPGHWLLQVEGNETDLEHLLRHLVQNNLPVYGFHEEKVNLEDAFMHITKGYVA